MPTAHHDSFYHISRSHFPLIVVCISLLITGYIASRVIASTPKRGVTDSPHTEMHSLPKKLAKKVAKIDTPTAIHIPILMYHYIEYVKDPRDILRHELDVLPNVFASQMQTLTQAGYTFLQARDVGEIIDGKESLPNKPIVLTFDDGHRDFYTDALPILEQYHAKATSYIITGFTGGTDFMTEDQIKAVLASGIVELGAHTVHHISLKNIPETTMRSEILGSKQTLEKLYHQPVVSFAYPNGAFDETAIQVVKQAGFTTAVSTIPGTLADPENRFYLYRLRPGNRTGSTLLSFLTRAVQASASAFLPATNSASNAGRLHE